MPVAVADIGAAEHAHIDPVALGMIAAAVFACFRASLEPVARGLKLAEVKRDHPCKMISFGQKCRVSTPFCTRDRLLDEACSPAQVGPHVIDVAEPPQRGEELSLALQLAAELLCALVYGFCLV